MSKPVASAKDKPAKPATQDVPAWVLTVSGMDRADIKGWHVVPRTNVLVIEDMAGATGHRFTFLPRQREG